MSIEAPHALTKENLTSPNEQTLFIVCLVFSILVWIPVVISIIGLLYVLIFLVVAWFANGLLIARLRAETVQVNESQYPELYATYVAAAEKLGMKALPEFYILQAGGILNAFATRHSGRNFVVIYSSYLELVEPDSAEIKFLIGHEFGHIEKNHLLKRAFLLPALLIPMLTEAYHRCNEATCDRYGAFVADDLEGASRGLLILGSGRLSGHLSCHNFACQHYLHRGFFVSWHELISSYPSLSKRIALILGIKDEAFRQEPNRNILAYFFAFFINWRMILVLYFIFIGAMIGLGKQVEDINKKIQAQQHSNASDPSAPSN